MNAKEMKMTDAENNKDVFKSNGFKVAVTILISLVTLVLCTVLILVALDTINADLFENYSAGQSQSGESPDGHTGNVMAYGDSSIPTLITVLIALFGVLITGIFVFMSIRVENGARREAQAIATDAAIKAEETAKEAAKKAKKKAEKVAKKRSNKVAKKVMKELEDRVQTAQEAATEARKEAGDAAKAAVGDVREEARAEAQQAAIQEFQRLLSAFKKGHE